MLAVTSSVMILALTALMTGMVTQSEVNPNPPPSGAMRTPPGTQKNFTEPRIVRINTKAPEWNDTRFTPLALAQKADRALNTASKISNQWRMIISIPEGVGNADGRWSVFSPSAWKLEAIDATGKAIDLTTRMYVADGKRWTRSAVGSWIAPQPISRWQATTPSVTFAKWTRSFPIGMAETVGSRRPFVAALLRDGAAKGMKFKAQVRTVSEGGKRITSYRIVGTGGKGGTNQAEIVFESSRGLPVTIRSFDGNATKPSRLFWTARWDFNSKQNFAPKDFVLPRK